MLFYVISIMQAVQNWPKSVLVIVEKTLYFLSLVIWFYDITSLHRRTNCHYMFLCDSRCGYLKISICVYMCMFCVEICWKNKMWYFFSCDDYCSISCAILKIIDSVMCSNVLTDQYFKKMWYFVSWLLFHFMCCAILKN